MTEVPAATSPPPTVKRSRRNVIADQQDLIISGKRKRRTVNRLVMSSTPGSSNRKQRYDETMTNAGRGSSLGAINPIAHVLRSQPISALRLLYSVIYGTDEIDDLRSSLRFFSGLVFDEKNESEMDRLRNRIRGLDQDEIKKTASLLCLYEEDEDRGRVEEKIVAFLLYPSEDKCKGFGPTNDSTTNTASETGSDQEGRKRKRSRNVPVKKGSGTGKRGRKPKKVLESNTAAQHDTANNKVAEPKKQEGQDKAESDKKDDKDTKSEEPAKHDQKPAESESKTKSEEKVESAEDEKPDSKEIEVEESTKHEDGDDDVNE